MSTAPLSSAAAAPKNQAERVSDDAARRVMDAMGIRSFADLAANAAKLEAAEMTTIGELLAAGKVTAKSQGKPKTIPSHRTRKALLAALPTITITIEGKSHSVKPRMFSTGSVGYNLNVKQELGGETCQIGANLTVCGSKELPAE